nr:PREDICTED: cytochrome P450 6j1-like isoform X1 [Bemisia tabaci]XP_018912979.1 PREDICTED: cytochrome P450 6j1-like isoform X1 [Bemisia tabaci]
MELLQGLLSMPSNSTLVCIGISLFVYYYLQDKVNYWAKRGVAYVPASKCLSLFIPQMLQNRTMLEVVSEQYDLLEGHSYGGVYQLTRPTVILRDPAMTKEWLVKGFTSFHDRGPEVEEGQGNLSENLFSLTGDRWHTVRTKLSPAFSSTKLKVMYQTLKGCAEELNAHLQGLCEKRDEAEIDIKDLVGRYAMDAIGACAMGIKCNAIKDPDNCEMKKAVKAIFTINWRLTLMQLCMLIHPKLVKIFGLAGPPKDLTKFLTSVTKQAMDMKTKSGQPRKDFLQIMMSASESETQNGKEHSQNGDQTVKSEDNIFTENVITGVISTFLSAGLDPVAATVTFGLYELAFHPEIQERLFEEIQAARMKSGGEIEYDDIKDMQYLEQVVNETLRLYPAAGFLFRFCREPFQIQDSSVVIEKSVNLLVPQMCIQRDPKYFPEPMKFDPERFSKENVDKILPGSYLPFGEGPRFCIANRFALMNAKTMMITLVSDYTLHPCAKTKSRMTFDKKTFTLSPEGEVWLKLKKRN